MAGLRKVMHCVGANLYVFGSSPGIFLSKGHVWSLSLTLVGIQCLFCTLFVDFWAYLIGFTQFFGLMAKPHGKSWQVFVNCENLRFQSSSPCFPSSSNVLLGGRQIGIILTWVTVSGKNGRSNLIRAMSLYLCGCSSLYPSCTTISLTPLCIKSKECVNTLKGCPQVTHPEAKKVGSDGNV